MQALRSDKAVRLWFSSGIICAHNVHSRGMHGTCRGGVFHVAGSAGSGIGSGIVG